MYLWAALSGISTIKESNYIRVIEIEYGFIF